MNREFFSGRGSMSAFQSYAGAYEFRGGRFIWRCYATARVYGVRRADHAPFPQPAEGKTWLQQPRAPHHSIEVAWLVDQGVEDFSQILLQVEPDAPTHAARRAEVGERATA